MKCECLRGYRALLPAAAACFLPALLAAALWASPEGRSMVCGLSLAGACALAAVAFAPEARRAAQAPAAAWGDRFAGLALALLTATAAVSAVSLALNDPGDYDVPLVALTGLVPALGMVPWLTLATRKPFAAAVFGVALVGLMKLLGGVVVVLTYGWDASERGHTTMPWRHPNLLVWTFWALTAATSLALAAAGARRYRTARGRVA